MDISEFSGLIKNLQVERHSVTTKFSRWENYFGVNRPAEVDQLFGSSPEIKISRKDIFSIESLKKKIYMTIFWGYPNGMRNNYHQLIFNQIEDIKDKLGQASIIRNWDQEILTVNFSGLGFSTYSKLLYFTKSTINSNVALILDNRIIECISKGTFSNFDDLRQITYNNASRLYPKYLSTMKDLAQQLKVDGDQIELFLFLFGNSIK
ncbi:MAG: hypothetical protein M0Q21_06845 [Ignavibacteriaceae bacterium]|nr:hypothetical protein [Ignavibacteriaceae bacterium]